MYRKPIHIKATPEKVSPKIITVGDPDRTRFIASFLKNIEEVNVHRGFLLYTGFYDGERISIACHGVGAPSAAIVFEELIMLGAKLVLRLGTTGALVPELRRGDIIVVSGAGYFKTSPVLQLTDDIVVPPVPDVEITLGLYRHLKEHIKDRNVVLGNVISNDMFYVENPELANKLSRLGFIGIEMECATLFTLSRIRGIRSGAVLLVSNSLVREEEREIPHSSEINRYYSDIVPLILKFISQVKL